METLKEQLGKLKAKLPSANPTKCLEQDDEYAKCPRCDQYIKKIYLIDHLESNHNESTDTQNKIKKYKKKWVTSTCNCCKKNIYHLPEWKNKSKYCKKCNDKLNKKNNRKSLSKVRGRKKNKRKSLSKVKGRYASVSFSRIRGYSVQGGSPGLGKKR